MDRESIVAYFTGFQLFWFAAGAFVTHSVRITSQTQKVIEDTRNRLVSLVHILVSVFLTSIVLLTQADINEYSLSY